MELKYFFNHCNIFNPLSDQPSLNNCLNFIISTDEDLPNFYDFFTSINEFSKIKNERLCLE